MKFTEYPVATTDPNDNGIDLQMDNVDVPEFVSYPEVKDDPFADTPDNFAERAKADYNFAMDKNITLGGLDALKKEWATASGLVKKIPIFGALYAAGENISIMNAANRLKNQQVYLQELALESGGQDVNDLSALYGIDTKAYIEKRKEKDQKLVSDFLEYLAADKTYMNKVISGASQLPTFMLEFVGTGGLATVGKETAIKASEKLISSYAKTAAGKIALKAAGFAGGAAARGTVGLGNRTLEKMSGRQLESVMGLREEEGWATSALTAWGDTVIETASEMSGEGLTTAGGFVLKKLPFGSKLTNALEYAWLKATGGQSGEFARKMLSKGGYSNILGEIGEERLGTILRAITDVDDFGAGKDANMIERLQCGILQDIENIGVEVGVLSIPAGGQVVLGQLMKAPKADFDSTQFDQTMAENQAARDNIEPSKQQPSGNDGIIVYHGTEADITADQIEPNQKLRGIYTTTSKEAAQTYGKNVFAYKVKPDAKVLDLSDGETLWKYMQDSGILTEADLQNIDLQNYTINGELFQFDISNKTNYADDVVAVAKEQGYDIVNIPDRLENSSDNIATIVINKSAISPQAEAGKGEQAKAEVDNVKEQEPIKPVTIESANTSQEVERVVDQIVTYGIGSTSARQANINEDRASVGLDGIASAARKSWQVSLQQAKDLNLIDTALRTAAEINSQPRPLNDVETAGLVMKAAQLKKEHKALTAQMESAKEKPDIDNLATKIDVVEQEFDALTQAIYKSGTEKGRALVSQKLTINQDFDLISLKNRAKKSKGRELTETEIKKIEQLSKDLELQQTISDELQRRINELMAKKTIKQGSIRRYSRMSRTEIDTELVSLVARTKQLLEEGC